MAFLFPYVCVCLMLIWLGIMKIFSTSRKDCASAYRYTILFSLENRFEYTTSVKGLQDKACFFEMSTK